MNEIIAVVEKWKTESKNNNSISSEAERALTVFEQINYDFGFRVLPTSFWKVCGD